MSPESAGRKGISAQVVLGSADGESVKHAYASAGFEVGGIVGNSFSITASVATFERIFKTKPNPEGGELELPVRSLPAPLRTNVSAVTFTAPPDFGPTNFDR